MKQVADGVWQLRGFPPDAINVYLAEDVLIDAGSRHAARRIFRQLKGHTVTAHALTHAHPDHQGSSDEVCGKLGVPFWVGGKDVPYAEEPARLTEIQSGHPFTKVGMKYFLGPGRNVDRALHEGDEIAGFKVLEVPGHSPGHIAFWRDRDGVLILGDVINNINVVTGMPGLHEPQLFVAFDAEQNRSSARRLAALEPKLMLFGHGRPLRDTRKFTDFVARLSNP
jgi:hydroxyacylglutathione hydrolase